MDKIILHKAVRKQIKTKRHSIVVKDDVYYRLIDIQRETGMTMENLVNTLLDEAIKNVEVVE